MHPVKNRPTSWLTGHYLKGVQRDLAKTFSSTYQDLSNKWMMSTTSIFYAHLWAEVEFVCLGMKFDRFKEKTAVIYISVSTDPSTSSTRHNFLRFTAGYD